MKPNLRQYKIIFGFFIILCSFLTQTAWAKGDDILRIEGEVSAVSKVPHFECGVFIYRAVIKYKVRSVLEGKFKGQAIFVVHVCPGDHFKAGDRFLLTLQPLRISGDRNQDIIDDFKDEDKKLYSCQRFDLVSPQQETKETERAQSKKAVK